MTIVNFHPTKANTITLHWDNLVIPYQEFKVCMEDTAYFKLLTEILRFIYQSLILLYQDMRLDLGQT